MTSDEETRLCKTVIKAVESMRGGLEAEMRKAVEQQVRYEVRTYLQNSAVDLIHKAVKQAWNSVLVTVQVVNK